MFFLKAKLQKQIKRPCVIFKKMKLGWTTCSSPY